MSRPNSSTGRSRDLGLPGGGKGSAARFQMDQSWRANFDEIIANRGVEGLKPVGPGKSRKTYK